MKNIVDIVKNGKLRTCYTMHHCFFCTKIISNGQRYYDKGHGNRIHKTCVDKQIEKLKEEQ